MAIAPEMHEILPNLKEIFLPHLKYIHLTTTIPNLTIEYTELILYSRIYF